MRIKRRTLIASSPSLEACKGLIANYFFDQLENIVLTEETKGTWGVSKLSGKQLPNFCVRYGAGRYRFESRA
jgi:hypothetical protein